MAGKTGTCQNEYWMTEWKDKLRYISSFAGYFPAENPKYSCIVVIHKPVLKKGIMVLMYLVLFLKKLPKKYLQIHQLLMK